MITIILDGLVLLGLMFLFDRKNPNRDFLETGLVAFILVIAAVLMNNFLTPLIAIRRAVVIAAVFVAFKILEPFVFRALLGS